MQGITIILPTLNEEKNILKIIRQILLVKKSAKIIVSDDGSKDRTKRAVLSLRSKQILFLDRGKKKVHGLTASAIDAILHVKTPYFIVMDADLQHPAKSIPEIAYCLESGADMAIAYRTGKKNSLPPHRKAISIGAHALASLRLALAGKPRPPDLTSGFFGMRTSLARSIILRSRFQHEGYKVMFELLKNLPKGAEVGLVPYENFAHRTQGISKFRPRHVIYFLRSLL